VILLQKPIVPLGLLFLSLSACEARVDTEEATIADQVVYEEQNPTDCDPVIFEEISLTHCIASPEAHSIRMVRANSKGEAFRSFAAYAAARPANAAPVAFAMNGGMFGENGEPVGYYVENGERLHTLDRDLDRDEGDDDFHTLPNGVFFGDTNDTWSVFNTERFYNSVSSRPDFGTQSGPMLVLRGELNPKFDPESDSFAIRNGVGIDPAGRAHFVISEEPVSIERFARYFRDVIGAPNALNLDGGVSQLWDPARERMDNRAPLGPMIVVEMREDSQ
jgi:uncharacterized protein YigE (DUF2233 family)